MGSYARLRPSQRAHRNLLPEGSRRGVAHNGICGRREHGGGAPSYGGRGIESHKGLHLQEKKISLSWVKEPREHEIPPGERKALLKH